MILRAFFVGVFIGYLWVFFLCVVFVCVNGGIIVGVLGCVCLCVYSGGVLCWAVVWAVGRAGGWAVVCAVGWAVGWPGGCAGGAHPVPCGPAQAPTMDCAGPHGKVHHRLRPQCPCSPNKLKKNY